MIKEELMDDISENIRKYKELKKKAKKIDFSRYTTARLLDEIKRYECDPETYLVIYHILRVRQRPVVLCREAKKTLERERLMSLAPVCFGFKNEAYFTEEEMLNGHNYIFEDLSISEKQIYNNQVKSCRI